jgi:sialic acid synthase SpsE
MIKYILKKKINVIISTGATTLDEIDLLMRKINYRKNISLISLLHCTSFYPAESKILNLDTIKFLIKKYKVKIGYSDHSDSQITGALAVMNGATLIEKHITLSKKMLGPDHKASLEYIDFKKYIENIKFALAAKGKEEKKLSRKELNVKKQMQKSLIYSKNLKKNTILKSNFIDSKRPASGISPLFFEKVVNKKLKKNVLKNKKIQLNDFL